MHNENALEQKQILQQRRLTLESLLSKETRNYFHFNTLDNFIYHFERISNSDDRQWVYHTLNNFFDEASGLIDQIDVDSSNTIYEEYLSKIASYYDSYLGFTMHTYLWVVVPMYLIALLILGYFLNFYLVLLLLSALFIYHMTYLYNKHKQKKLFGTFY